MLETRALVGGRGRRTKVLRNRLWFIAVEHCRESICALVFTASRYLSLVCDPRHASDNSVGKNGASSRERDTSRKGARGHHASNGSRRLRGDTLHHVVRSDLYLFRSGGPAPQRTTRGRIVLLHRALDALGRFPAIRKQALARVAVRARPTRYSPLATEPSADAAPDGSQVSGARRSICPEVARHAMAALSGRVARQQQPIVTWTLDAPKA